MGRRSRNNIALHRSRQTYSECSDRIEPAFVLSKIDVDCGIGEHAPEVGVAHVRVNNERCNAARREPIDERLRDERFTHAAFIAMKKMNARAHKSVGISTALLPVRGTVVVVILDASVVFDTASAKGR